MAELQQSLIDPDLYRQTLSKLVLRKISLDHVQATCIRDLTEVGDVQVQLSYEARVQQTSTNFDAFITYALQSDRAGAEFLSIEATYRLTFDADAPVPDGFFEVYQRLNLRLTTMPYFRELVASMTGRMELPTLTLPYELIASEKQKPAKVPAEKPTRQKRIQKAAPTQ